MLYVIVPNFLIGEEQIYDEDTFGAIKNVS